MKKAFTCLVEIFIIGIQKIELHYRIMEKKHFSLTQSKIKSRKKEGTIFESGN